jgi:AhpD family alkylhydroperoxidase
MIQKVAECYTEGAEILTQRGFVKFSELNEDDIVAQVDDNNKLSFVKPLVILKKEYEGDIIAYDSAKCKMEVTLNHRVVTTDGVIVASELYDNLRQRKFPYIPRSVSIDKEKDSEFSDEELVLAGYAAADGYVSGMYGNLRINVSREEKIEKIIHDRKTAHAYYLKNSRVYRSFSEMEQKTYSDGELEKRYKELIAIGISIIDNCESCLEWHIKQALDSGATEKQVIEAVEVGIEMGGGPATVSSRFAMKVLEYYQEEQ